MVDLVLDGLVRQLALTPIVFLVHSTVHREPKEIREQKVPNTAEGISEGVGSDQNHPGCGSDIVLLLIRDKETYMWRGRLFQGLCKELEHERADHEL